jgi:ATP-binding cassette subfamily G (WHITE) protein 2 (PDR)
VQFPLFIIVCRCTPRHFFPLHTFLIENIPFSFPLPASEFLLQLPQTTGLPPIAVSPSMNPAGGNLATNYDHQATTGGFPGADMEALHPSRSHEDPKHPDSEASTIAAEGSPKSRNQVLKESHRSAQEEAHDAQETARREDAVHQLARRLTIQSQHTTSNQNPFNAEPNSALDPKGENFNARAWTKAMLNLQLEDENVGPTRTAGVCFRDLNVHGFGADTDYQKSVGNVWFEGPGLIKKLRGDKGRQIDILQHMDGLVEAGEMLVVLGPPGSGCSTFLKTITGETHGFFVDPNSRLNYQGVSPELMNKNYRGEAIYTAEVDVHFPAMTVGETLYFAAQARRPRNIPGGVSVHQYAEHQRDVIMAL